MDIEKEKIGRLIEQIQGGNNEAFEELYRLTSPKAYFVALQIVRNEHDAEDVLQETYIKVLEKIGEIDPSQSFMGWLYRVVSNKSKNLLKRKNALTFEAYEDEFFEEIPDEATEFNPEENLNQDETCREVMAAIDELSDEKRVCVIMKYFGEMTVGEIAESLEVPESTVKNRLFVARKELKSKLEKKNAAVFCSVAPAAAATWALSRAAESVSAEFSAGSASAAVLTGVGASSASTATAAAVAGTAAKAVALSAAQKVAAGVAAVSIIGGSAAGVVTVVKNKNTPDNSTTTCIEEVTTAPSQTAKYVFDFITEATEPTSEAESTIRKEQTFSNTSTTVHLTTERYSTKPVTTQRITTTQKATTTKSATTRAQTTARQETTAVSESTTRAETTAQPTTTETTTEQTTTESTTQPTTQAPAILVIEIVDMNDEVVDTLNLSVEAGTELTREYLVTVIRQNGYEAMAGVYGDSIGVVAQAETTYTFTAEL